MSDLRQRADAKLDALEATAEAPELTEAGNAERFIRRHGRDCRYVPEWGWLTWTGTHWSRDELRVRQRMTETARAIHAEAAAEPDGKRQRDIAAWAVKSQQARAVGAALWLAQPELAAAPDQFDREPWLLPVVNGTVDLRTGDLHRHRREHYCTKLAPARFDPSATAPTWEAFLSRVLPDSEVRRFVQRLAGYSLTGCTDEQVLAFLYGGGRNGKSVFLETLGAMLGEFHRATRIDTLSVTSGGGIPNDVAALAGARMVTVSETPEGARLNESLVKDLTGGDTISARFMRREFFDFRPQFTLWIRGNHKPQIRGTDDGIWRRLLLVPFTVQIPPGEVDPALPEKLRGELPGILAWAVQGCREWQRIGLCPPDAVSAAVREYRAEQDILGEFLAECCITGPNVKAPASDLYRAYRAWCEETGHQAVSATRFGTSLGERGFDRRKPKSIVWHGVGLLSDGSDGCDPFPSSRHTRARDESKPEKGSATVGLSDCPRCDGEGCGHCTRVTHTRGGG